MVDGKGSRGTNGRMAKADEPGRKGGFVGARDARTTPGNRDDRNLASGLERESAGPRPAHGGSNLGWNQSVERAGAAERRVRGLVPDAGRPLPPTIENVPRVGVQHPARQELDPAEEPSRRRPREGDPPV